MGDRCEVHIEFGGMISRGQLAELVMQAGNYGLKDIYMDADASADNIAEGWIGEQVNYGELGRITAFCEMHNIPYKLWNGPGGEYGPGLQVLRDECTRTCGCNWEGEPVLEMNELLQIDALVSRFAELVQEAKFFVDPLPPLEIAKRQVT